MAGPLERIRTGVLIVVVSVGINGLLVWTLHRQPGEPISLAQPTPAPTATTAPTATPVPIVVHVSGAVATPGVYEVPAESRVADAIEAAGGLSDDAYSSALNQAAALQDGVQVYVPTEDEAAPPAAGTNSAAPASSTDNGNASDSSQININTAGASRLEELPGIGPALAERIIAHRNANGPFASLDALANVKGIGEKTLEDLRPHITLGR